MKSKNADLKWFYHIAVVGLVVWELSTIQEAQITIGNYLAVFIVVGLVSTLISVVFISWHVGRVGTNFLLRKLWGYYMAHLVDQSETVDCNGKQVPVWFIDDRSIPWKFNRPAMEDNEGGIPLSQLRDDECVKAPGAIYRRDPHI